MRRFDQFFPFTPYKLCEILHTNVSHSPYIRIPFVKSAQQWHGPMFFRVHITTSTYCLTKVNDVRIALVLNKSTYIDAKQYDAHVENMTTAKNAKIIKGKRWNNYNFTVTLCNSLFQSFSQFAIFLAAKWVDAECMEFIWHIRQTGMKWTKHRNGRSSF